MIQFHNNVISSLKHAGTWAGLSGVLGTTAQALPDPHKTHVTIAAGVCGALACIIKSPDNSQENKPDDGGS